jgi:CRP-like cAMP-binding protein
MASPTSQPPVAATRDLPLFDFLDTDAADYLASRLIIRTFASREIILREGEPPEGLGVIGLGRVDVRRADPETGADVLLAVLQAGDFFGEMSLISGEPTAATVSALEPTTVWYIRRSDFWDLLITHPLLGLNMCRAQVQRLGRTNQRIRLRHVNLALVTPSLLAVSLVPIALVKAYRVVPIDLADGVLVLGMVDPTDRGAIELVRRQAAGCAIDPVRISQADYETFVASQGQAA